MPHERPIFTEPLREQHSAIRGREHDGRLTLHTPLMKIYIKYMVSLRCKMLVISVLEKLGLMHGEVELGEVEIRDNLFGTDLRKPLGVEMIPCR